MLRNRRVVFVMQFVVVAVIWGLFLALFAKHPIDGWFFVQAIGVGLVVALAVLWRTSRAIKPRGRS